MNALKHSSFPHGFGGGVAIRGMPVLNSYSGNVLWVHSGGSANGDGTFKRPYTTIDQAIGACSASKGDMVMVKAGHAEAISTADIDADVAGISIVGLGVGANMPTITFTGTTDTTKFDISAANVSVSGLRFFFDDNDAVDSALTINGVNAEVSGCDFIAGANDQPDTFITVGVADNDADGAYIHNNRLISATAGAVSAILLAKDHLNIRIEDNHIDGDWSDAGISAPAAGDACLALSIQRNYVRNVNSGDWAIEITGTASSGIIADNRLVTDAQATALDAGACSCMGNLWQISTGGDAEGVPVNPTGDVSTNFIGVDDADNAATTTNVVANRDGSVLERLEAIYAAQVDDVAGNLIGFDDSNNVGSSANVVANVDGSLLERDEALQVSAAPSKNHPNYFTVTADMTSATWNTVAAHEIATVTGAVRMQIMVEVTATVVTTGTNGTIALGFEGNVSAIFSATALDAALTGDVFSAVYGAAATTPASGADAQSALTHAIFDVVAVAGKDVGYTIATNAATNGTLTFHVWWQPLDATGAVVAGAGGAL